MDRTATTWTNVLVATSAALTLNVLIAPGATAALAMQGIQVILGLYSLFLITYWSKDLDKYTLSSE